MSLVRRLGGFFAPSVSAHRRRVAEAPRSAASLGLGTSHGDLVVRGDARAAVASGWCASGLHELWFQPPPRVLPHDAKLEVSGGF